MKLSPQTYDLFDVAAQLVMAYPKKEERMPETVYRVGAALFCVLGIFSIISLSLDVDQYRRDRIQG